MHRVLALSLLLSPALCAPAWAGSHLATSSLSAIADPSAGRSAFSFEYSTHTSKAGKAYLVVRSAAAHKGLVLRLVGSDGTRLQRTLSFSAGGQQKISWTQMLSDVHYELEVGDASAPAFSFDVHRPSAGAAPGSGGGQLVMVSSDEDLIDRQSISYRLPFAIVRYRNLVYGLDGQVLAEHVSDAKKSYAAGEQLDLSWNTDQEVFMVRTRVEDAKGRYAEAVRVPWSFDIPHTDLVFPSGSARIQPAERAKLDEAFAILVHTLARLDRAGAAVGQRVGVKLYVVGHTDTVGSSKSNEKLSGQRAQAIAKYFRDKGAWCGIEYAGMGERGLAQPTRDNVDNQANRRAVYTLALSPPQGSKRPRASQYKTLTGPTTRRLKELPALPASFVEYQQNKERAQLGAEKAQRLAKAEASQPSIKASERSADSSQAASDEVQLQAQGPGSDSGASSSKAQASSAKPAPPSRANAVGGHGKRCALDPERPRPWLWLWLAPLMLLRRPFPRFARKESA